MAATSDGCVHVRVDRVRPQVHVTLTVGSLFAGVGGFDLAAERAGMEVAWQSENDLKASAVLAHHWPDIPNHGDIHGITMETDDLQEGVRRIGPRDSAGADDGRRLRRTITDTDLVVDGGTDGTRTAAAVDVLCGGFPCQDYSVAGSRTGLVGDRGALWWQYHRLIVEARPTWVVAENVPGLLSSRDGQDFATIIDSLTEHGYGVVWAVLDAQWFGVAQRRRRVFIVGHSGGRPRPEILALAEGVFGHPEPSRETGPVASSLTGSSVGGRGGPDDNAAQANHLVAFGSKDYGADAATDLAPTLRSGNYTDSHLSGGVPPAIASGATVRRLTPLECERLQGFPSVILLDMRITRDEIIAVALASGHLRVDFETGHIYRTRGPGGHVMTEPKRWGTSEVNGYLCGTIINGDVRRQARAHRVVWIAANGVPDEGMAVCHRDNDKQNNALENLYLATHEQNSTDAANDGLYKNDERRKLSDADLVTIVYEYHHDGGTMRQLAERYGVSKSRIHQVVHMDNWTDIPGNSDSQRYRQMGNAVAVPVAEWIMRRIQREDPDD